MDNPYESPKHEDEKSFNANGGASDSKPFLTNRRVFWIGLGFLIVLPLITQLLHQVVMASGWRFLNEFSIVLGWITVIGMFVGLIGVLVNHWFPDPQRKYPWRRKNEHNSLLDDE